MYVFIFSNYLFIYLLYFYLFIFYSAYNFVYEFIYLLIGSNKTCGTPHSHIIISHHNLKNKIKQKIIFKKNKTTNI